MSEPNRTSREIDGKGRTVRELLAGHMESPRGPIWTRDWNFACNWPNTDRITTISIRR